MKKKILILFGTRPEAIKMAPVIKEFNKNPDHFELRICVTAQHREMLDQVLDFFDIYPHYDLNLMKPNQNLFELTSNIISGLKPILDEFNPDYVFVHGDTTTTMGGSIASFYNGSKICHVEAGLRTYNKSSPFPEEMNRQITSRLSDIHFAPTETSKSNLINENICDQNIIVTGNTVIDALLDSVNRVKKYPSKFILDFSKKIRNKEMILVTGHRRENHGDGFINICNALKKIALDDINRVIVYPVHLNPKVQKPVNEILSGINNIILMEPLPYKDFVWMMNRAKIIITDSGGVQEEAPSLGKPVLVMRNTTERPEAVKAGTVVLVGTDTNLIVKETLSLINDKNRFESMSKLHNPYGDGRASIRIVDYISKIQI